MISVGTATAQCHLLYNIENVSQNESEVNSFCLLYPHECMCACGLRLLYMLHF